MNRKNRITELEQQCIQTLCWIDEWQERLRYPHLYQNAYTATECLHVLRGLHSELADMEFEIAYGSINDDHH